MGKTGQKSHEQKGNVMNSFVEKYHQIKLAHKQKDNVQCLNDLITSISFFSGASEWNDREIQGGVYLYGAGQAGAEAFSYLSGKGLLINGYIDDTPEKAGTTFCGVSVSRLDPLVHSQKPIIITMTNWAIVAERLSGMGIRWERYEIFIIRTNFKQISDIHDNFLQDERSRLVYLRVLKARCLEDDALFCAVCEDNQYWALPEFSHLIDPKGVMVDAGAYVGDTLEELIWRSFGVFGKYYAFEPAPKLYSALQNRVCRLIKEWALSIDSIECVEAGLGDQAATIPFYVPQANEVAGSFVRVEKSIDAMLRILTLDGYLKGGPITFLKADIEGGEMGMLHGAKNSIKQHKPKIAISIYHRCSDLIEIPLLIHEMVPDYKMAVRHHKPNKDDTVLYCWL
jgi:FkbM family methyltransferase